MGYKNNQGGRELQERGSFGGGEGMLYCTEGGSRGTGREKERELESGEMGCRRNGRNKVRRQAVAGKNGKRRSMVCQKKDGVKVSGAGIGVQGRETSGEGARERWEGGMEGRGRGFFYAFGKEGGGRVGNMARIGQDWDSESGKGNPEGETRVMGQ